MKLFIAKLILLIQLIVKVNSQNWYGYKGGYYNPYYTYPQKYYNNPIGDIGHRK